MKIKTMLHLNIILAITLLFLTALIFFWSFQQIREAIQKNKIADQIVKDVFDLNLLTNEYLLYHEKRPKEQWQLKYESLAKLVQTHTFQKKEDRVALEQIQQDSKNMDKNFSQLVANHERWSNKNPSLQTLALERRLVGLLLVQSQSLVNYTEQLKERKHMGIMVVLQNTTWVLLGLFPIVIIVMTGSFVWTTRRIVKSLTIFQEGTQIIGSGHLDYKINFMGKDELGELARAFDRMTEKLKTITVSRDELEQRVQERAEELNHANQKLEQRVQERTEELNHANQELQRSNEELKQFVYVASHDLQEPLRMISSYLQLLERRYQGKLDTDADDFIAYAVDGANRMQKLIQGLLVYSRVERKRKGFSPTDLSIVFEQAVAGLQKVIGETNATVTHGPLPMVMVDGIQLKQVFQNLIDNAIRFHSDQPPKVHLEVETTEREWLFMVRDNGIGIKPEHTERIFAIFQRLHSRSEYPGTGIGLAICKRIVERHGGHIWVESQPGKGTTFYFTIPKREGHHEIASEWKNH